MPVANERGLALIVAVAILLVFAVVTAVLVSLVSTDSDMALYQFRSGEATYIANGGMQYAMMRYQNYPNFSIPPFSTRAGTPQILLGSGGFTVDSPGVLSAAVTAAAATIPAVCFDRGVASVPCSTLFPPSGRILVESELIDYTGVTAASFTGAARGGDGSLAVAHAVNAGIYPATGLTVGVTNAGATVSVGSTTGFTIPGTIKIDQEYLYCTGRTAITFTGCTRGVQGSRVMAHNALATAVQVTMTVNATVQTGIAGSAQRVIKGQASVYRDGWVVANGGTTSRWNGINWDNVTSGVGANLNSTFLIDSNNDGAAEDGWAVGDPGGGEVLLRWNGATWSRWPPSGGIPNVALNSVYCTASNDCWAVGNPGGGEVLLRWNGATWSRWPASGSIPDVALNSVYCMASNDCWVVGNRSGGQPLLVHWDGAGWTRFATAGLPNEHLNSVYCVATTDCWAVGNAGGGGQRPHILHWDGADWTLQNGGLNINIDLRSIHCNSSADCWTTGNNGLILHWNGTVWSQYPSPTANRINGVFMLRPTNFLRIGDWQEVY